MSDWIFVLIGVSIPVCILGMVLGLSVLLS